MARRSRAARVFIASTASDDLTHEHAARSRVEQAPRALGNIAVECDQP